MRRLSARWQEMQTTSTAPLQATDGDLRRLKIVPFQRVFEYLTQTPVSQ